MSDELEKIYGATSGFFKDQQSAQLKSIDAQLALTSNEMIKAAGKVAPTQSTNVIAVDVRSTFDSRPVNTVDTFGIVPVLVGGNLLIDPASIPMTWSYSVRVPTGRTYFLRDFYLVPTRFLYDTVNNPIADLLHCKFLINDIPVSENSDLIFSSYGTGGYVQHFIVAPENSTIKLQVQITNAAYVTLGLPFPVYMGMSINMRFNALLSNGEPANFQVGNVIDKANMLAKQTEQLNGLDFTPVLAGNKYTRPKL